MYWYTKAAEQGHAGAQNNLGVMYDNGEGVPEDTKKAHMWYNISAVNGGLSADVRAHIEDRMSPYQTEKAQEMARECVAKNYRGC